MSESNSSRSSLSAFLSQCVGAPAEVVEISRVEGGWSRQLHRVVLADGQIVALRGEVLAGVIESDLAREFAILSAMSGSTVPLPRLIGFDSTGDVVGYRFIAMDWIDGQSPNLWRQRVEQTLPGVDLATLGHTWTQDIVRLHDIDAGRLQSAGLDAEVDGDGYVVAQTSEWAERIEGVVDHPGNLVTDACRWLAQSRPAAAEPTVVHGDLRLGNMLVQDGRVSAFLDWEMAGVGDWRADIGYSLMPYNAGKFLSAIEPSWNQLLAPRRFLDLYATLSGRSMLDDELIFFMVLGCVKMIGILCTGIEAYRSGRSDDPRLAWTSLAVPGLVDDICRLIDSGLGW